MQGLDGLSLLGDKIVELFLFPSSFSLQFSPPMQRHRGQDFPWGEVLGWMQIVISLGDKFNSAGKLRWWKVATEGENLPCWGGDERFILLESSTLVLKALLWAIMTKTRFLENSWVVRTHNLPAGFNFKGPFLLLSSDPEALLHLFV